MKKMLFFVLLSTIPFLSRSQNAFAPLGAEWHYFGSYYSMDGWGEMRNTLLRARVTADTTIAGIQCRKIEQKAIAKNFVFGPNSTAFTAKDSVFFRPLYVYDNTDTVFIYNDNFGKFTPLYVFNAEEGDTLCLPVIPDNTGNSNLLYNPISGDTSFCIVIDSIRNIVYDTTTLKTFYSHFVSDLGTLFSDEVPIYNWSPYHVSHATKGVYAERIGGVRAPLLPTRIDTWVEKPTTIIQTLGFDFRCYTDDVYHINVSNGVCDSMPPDVLSIKEPFGNAGIEIYPNPSTGIFSLKVRQPFSSTAEIIITDLSGRLIRSFPFPRGKGKMDIQLNDVRPGIYFMILNTSAGKYYQKIIIRP